MKIYLKDNICLKTLVLCGIEGPCLACPIWKQDPRLLEAAPTHVIVSLLDEPCQQSGMEVEKPTIRRSQRFKSVHLGCRLGCRFGLYKYEWSSYGSA